MEPPTFYAHVSIYLRSYAEITSHYVTFVEKMAKKLDTIEFINLVRQHPILWDARRDDYKLTENKPIVWDKIAETVKCDRGEHWHTIYV